MAERLGGGPGPEGLAADLRARGGVAVGGVGSELVSAVVSLFHRENTGKLLDSDR